MSSNEEPKSQSLHCGNCGKWLCLTVKKFDQIVDGIHVVFDDIPILICISCKNEFQPDRTKRLISYVVSKAKEKGSTEYSGTRNTWVINKRYDFCKDVNFIYDATDCQYIPGLWRDIGKEGALTPVFFNRRVLHKYLSFDEYFVDIASDTYGTIYHPSGYISFGVNRNGKIIMWLCDLDELPLNEQYYLRSENIESDHDVGSEFYQAQIEAKFTELSQEHQLLKSKAEFEKFCFDNFQLHVFRYPTDIYETLKDLIRPVNWNEKGLTHVINSLNKICVESINPKGLRAEIKKLDNNVKTKDLRSLKLLEKWIELRFPELDAKEIMKPFFVLNDFRQVFDHDLGDVRETERLESCYTRMGITDKNKNYESLYDSLINSITKSFCDLTTNNK